MREVKPFLFSLQCCHVVERLDKLSILKEEYYLLKALVLTNSDVKIEEYQSLKKFRDSILASLSDTVGILRWVVIIFNDFEDFFSHFFFKKSFILTILYVFRPMAVVSHVQQLLLCLPALRQANHVIRRFWSDVHQRELVHMNKLFLEMLEAYCR